MEMSKNKIFAFYAVLIIVFGIIGYHVGKKSDKANLYASVAVVLGAVVCSILWFTVGKKMVE